MINIYIMKYNEEEYTPMTEEELEEYITIQDEGIGIKIIEFHSIKEDCLYLGVTDVWDY